MAWSLQVRSTSHPKTGVFSFQTCYRGSLYLEYSKRHSVQYLVISKARKRARAVKGMNDSVSS